MPTQGEQGSSAGGFARSVLEAFNVDDRFSADGSSSHLYVPSTSHSDHVSRRG